jgi:hypothetical protein
VLDLIGSKEAARLLGLPQHKLLLSESIDGLWTYVLGGRLRVFRIGTTAKAQRRYRRADVLALAQQGRPHR